MVSAVEAARHLLGSLIAAGMGDLVVCPGSRSGPLAYAAFEAASAGAVRLYVRADERSAGFLALGIARSARRRPVGIVTTSGTAVGNLHPAVLEADAARVPIVILSADRPTRLQAVRANQTCDQQDIFGRAARGWWQIEAPGPDAAAVAEVGAQAISASVGESAPGGPARGGGVASAYPGPVQVNCRFDDPLFPGQLDATWAAGLCVPTDERWAREALAGGPTSARLEQGPRTVVIAGDGAGPRAAEVAASGGWPLFAEPSSGARGGPQAIQCYRLLLAGELGQRIERAVVYGHPTLHRGIAQLLGRVHTVVVEPGGGPWFNPGGVADRVVGDVVVPLTVTGGPPARTSWLDAWIEADRRARARLTDFLDQSTGLTGLHVARAVGAWGGQVYLGASNPVRDFDLAAPLDGRRRVWAGRGLAGIDGCLSSAAGVALGTGEPVCALVGDLTFLHDAGALMVPRAEAEPDVRVVVISDGGGAIFAGLDHGHPGRSAAFGRMFAVEHDANVAAIAAGYGVEARRVGSEAELTACLAQPVRGRSVVEVPVAAQSRAALDAAIAGQGVS